MPATQKGTVDSVPRTSNELGLCKEQREPSSTGESCHVFRGEQLGVRAQGIDSSSLGPT